MANGDWTTEAKLQALLALPWTLQFSKDPVDGSLIARIAELPDAIGTGETERELATAVYDALEASLDSRLEHDDPIPLPPGCELPWAKGRTPIPTPVILLIKSDFSALSIVATPSSTSVGELVGV